VTTQGNATITNVPGMDFSFRKTDAPQSATKGRSLDHIGFEVRGLGRSRSFRCQRRMVKDAFCVREVSPQHLAGACLIDVRLDVRA
jgi:hypothetical protein